MCPLTDQARKLLSSGPQPGIPAAAMTAVVDLLVRIARDLDSLHYFALQDADGGWWMQPLDLPSNPTNSHHAPTHAPTSSQASTELWMAAFAHRSDAEATAIALRQTSEQHGISNKPFSVVKLESLRLLFLCLGLSLGTGVIVYEDSPPSDIDARLSKSAVPAKLVRRDELNIQLVKALKSMRTPPGPSIA